MLSRSSPALGCSQPKAGRCVGPRLLSAASPTALCVVSVTTPDTGTDCHLLSTLVLYESFLLSELLGIFFTSCF